MEFEIRNISQSFKVFEKGTENLIGTATKISSLNNQNLVLDVRIVASMPEGGLSLA